MVYPPIALERLRYRPETGQVIYYGRQRGCWGDAEPSPARISPALDFLAALCTHVPDSGHQLIRYYGAFANARRLCAGAPASPSASPQGAQAMPQDNSDSGEEFARGRRRSWARLIKRVYEADPLVCPRCSGPLKIISLIGDGAVIEGRTWTPTYLRLFLGTFHESTVSRIERSGLWHCHTASTKGDRPMRGAGMRLG